MSNRVLITGGAGFIGSNLANFLLAQGDEVWVVDNLQSGLLKNIAPFRENPKFRFSESEICQWKELETAVAWADRIYHLAANVGQKMVLAHPISTISTNIRGCEVLLEAMGRVQSKARLLITSTSEVYFHSEEDADGKVAETADMIFQSGKFLQETYPISKLVNEITTLCYANKTGAHCTIARLFNTIGVNQRSTYAMVVPSFIEQALANKPMTIFGDGEQTRSFCDVRDIVRAIHLLIESDGSRGQIVNVGRDKECSINELAEVVKRITNSSSEVRYLTYQEAYGVDFHDVRRRCPNLKKLVALTGFTHEYTLEDTIKEIINNI
jgi:UDP-glucose 4-epimerase